MRELGRCVLGGQGEYLEGWGQGVIEGYFE